MEKPVQAERRSLLRIRWGMLGSWRLSSKEKEEDIPDSRFSFLFSGSSRLAENKGERINMTFKITNVFKPDSASCVSRSALNKLIHLQILSKIEDAVRHDIHYKTNIHKTT